MSGRRITILMVVIDKKQIETLSKNLKQIKGDMRKFNSELPSKTGPKIIKYLKRVTPKDTGDTSNSWKMKKLGSNGFVIENDNGDIVEFLMFGVKPHKIEPKEKSVLVAKLGTSILFAKFVDHPGYGVQLPKKKTFDAILKIVQEESGMIVNKKIKRRLS